MLLCWQRASPLLQMIDNFLSVTHCVRTKTRIAHWIAINTKFHLPDKDDEDFPNMWNQIDYVRTNLCRTHVIIPEEKLIGGYATWRWNTIIWILTKCSGVFIRSWSWDFSIFRFGHCRSDRWSCPKFANPGTQQSVVYSSLENNTKTSW